MRGRLFGLSSPASVVVPSTESRLRFKEVEVEAGGDKDDDAKADDTEVEDGRVGREEEGGTSVRSLSVVDSIEVRPNSCSCSVSAVDVAGCV